MRDNGGGISDDKLETIRKSIGQNSNTQLQKTKPNTASSNSQEKVLHYFEEKPSSGGLGFGLTTTAFLMKLLGGEISFSSIPWYKTDVIFSFAIKRAPDD